jgi:hypothetical protein
MTDPDRQQVFEQLPPRLAERLHSSDGEVARKDRLGRKMAKSGPAGFE